MMREFFMAFGAFGALMVFLVIGLYSWGDISQWMNRRARMRKLYVRIYREVFSKEPDAGMSWEEIRAILVKGGYI